MFDAATKERRFPKRRGFGGLETAAPWLLYMNTSRLDVRRSMFHVRP